jgi:hypothetical protein
MGAPGLIFSGYSLILFAPGLRIADYNLGVD